MRNLLVILVSLFLCVSNITAQKIKISIVAGTVMATTKEQSNSFTHPNDSNKGHSDSVKVSFHLVG
jgi:hypothetical protein